MAFSERRPKIYNAMVTHTDHIPLVIGYHMHTSIISNKNPLIFDSLVGVHLMKNDTQDLISKPKIYFLGAKFDYRLPKGVRVVLRTGTLELDATP